jgi:hypothetical protein
MTTFKTFFNENGDLLDEVYEHVLKNGGDGELAKAYLAGEFASTTHGNYSAEIFYSRLSILGDVTIGPAPNFK